jgi:hypothetical protein
MPAGHTCGRRGRRRRIGHERSSDTLTLLLAGQQAITTTLTDIQTELAVIRPAQEHLGTMLLQMTETWTGMFRQLGLQLELLAEHVGNLATRLPR